MAKILIAGCGDVGCRLGSLLVDANHEVLALRRNVEEIPEAFIAIQADLTHKIQNAPDKIDYVVYMASAGKYKDSAYYNAYVLGLKNLIQAVQGQKIKRLFFVSSSSVFAQSDGEKVDESSPTDEHSFSAKRILEGEGIAFNSDLDATVVRFGGIYGPGRTHLIDLVRNGKAHCMEDVWSNRIHSDDCAGILAHLINMDLAGSPVEELYLGVDCQPTLSCEVYDWLAEQLCVPDVEHTEPSENSRMLRSNKRISNAKILATGYKFLYPNYQDGYANIIDDMENELID